MPNAIPLWLKSRSLSLRNYRLSPQSAASLALGMSPVPGPPILQGFMEEGASDEEILSRWPAIRPVEIKDARVRANRNLQRINRLYGRKR